MGQPKLPRKHVATPNHPWQGDRIKAEHEIRRKFGLKNKTEIWRAQTRLREIRGQARMLVSRTRNPDDQQAHREAKLLLTRLHRSGYVGEEATLNDVLGLDIERILNRRLQSQVYLKGYARTPKQARQFVSHGHIRIGDRRVMVPGYVVRREEEEILVFDPQSPVADEEHPVRPRAPGADAMADMEPVDKAAQKPADQPEAATTPADKAAEPAPAEKPAEKAATKPADAPATKEDDA